MKPLRATSDLTARPLQQVLYVEDEEDNRQVATLRLAGKYELLLASSDREACRLLTVHGPRLVAVLMDIQLKGSLLDGMQLTRLLRGRLPVAAQPEYARGVPTLPELPVIFVTAYGSRYSSEELEQAGGNELIAKPVDFVRLMSALTRHHLSTVRGFTG
jgi:CheY-like chemotaxis protein